VSVEQRLAYWQRRARDAERQLEYERDAYERCRSWAVDGPFAHIRRLEDRCTFLYGIAVTRGATTAELRREAPDA
jgi:hypothetical protein